MKNESGSPQNKSKPTLKGYFEQGGGGPRKDHPLGIAPGLKKCSGGDILGTIWVFFSRV